MRDVAIYAGDIRKISHPLRDETIIYIAYSLTFSFAIIHSTALICCSSIVMLIVYFFIQITLNIVDLNYFLIILVSQLSLCSSRSESLLSSIFQVEPLWTISTYTFGHHRLLSLHIIDDHDIWSCIRIEFLAANVLIFSFVNLRCLHRHLLLLLNH
jgi:hypothetical protein